MITYNTTAEVSYPHHRYQQRMYILVKRQTASAAEVFAFTLQAQKRAVVIGQASAGGAHMNSWYPVNDEIYVSVSTAAPVLPGTMSSWDGKGVNPDHVVEGEGVGGGEGACKNAETDATINTNVGIVRIRYRPKEELKII